MMRDAIAREDLSEEEQRDEPTGALLEERVDVVIADHRVVVAELESRARRDALKAGFTQPVGRRDVPSVAKRAWRKDEVHLDETVLRDRTERARLLRELDPGVVRPAVEPPFVTRVGVFYVAPEFYQVKGLDRHMDAELLRDGIRSAEAFLLASDTRIARLTGLTLGEVDRAKADLDLTRLPSLRRDAADLLRLAGVHSVSSLADADPLSLTRRLHDLRARHRFLEFPSVLSSLDTVTTLVSEATGHA